MQKVTGAFGLLLCSIGYVCADESCCQVSTDVLDELACKHGTDKSLAFHNYTEVYANLFAEWKDKPLNFLEIGIEKGNSLRLWHEYFRHPDAQLYFLDIDKSVVELGGRTDVSQEPLDRVLCYVCDQADSNQLNEFCKTVGKEFDIIIDDGGHTMPQQITSFVTLFPYLKSGGVYVVEDLHTSYFNQYGGTFNSPTLNRGTAIGFLVGLIDDLNYTGAITWLADFKKFPTNWYKNYYHEHIKSIQFYSSLCLVFKR